MQRHAQQMQFDQEKHAQEVAIKREDMAMRQRENETRAKTEMIKAAANTNGPANYGKDGKRTASGVVKYGVKGKRISA
jgi:hypothetical protein